MTDLECKVSQQIEQDIERRTLNGTYIYLLGWLAIGIGTKFYQHEPLWFYSIASAFLLFGVSRLVFYRYSAHIKEYSRRLWWALLSVNVVLPCLVFSTVSALSMFMPLFQPLLLYVFMAMFAFISSGTVTYSLSRNLYRAYLAANILIPVIVVPIFATTVEAKLEAGMLIFYSIYMLFQGQQLNRQYQEKIEQAQTLQELSNKDGLTGVYNRRYFDQYVDHIWNHQLRQQQRLTLIIVDIDHFKRVNDQYGHPAGDEVIKQLSRLMSETFQRETDVIARIGGEEFAVVIPNVDHEQVLALTEQLRVAMADKLIEYNEHTFSVTISAGLASATPCNGVRSDSLLNQADKALYRAKAHGRNLIFAHQKDPEHCS